MNKFNQLIKEIIQRQKKYAKEREKSQRSLKKALKYLKINREKSGAKKSER